jgi:hypothetical protein
MMDELERDLNRRTPIDDIAALVRTLTYGEMVQLADEIWKAIPADQNTALTLEALPATLHTWQKDRQR